MAIKKTVLEYVQATLTAMESDQVDAIADTEEAIQVAETLRDIYYELLERQDWEWLRKPIAVASAADVAQPTNLVLPVNATQVDDIWYNTAASGHKPRKLKWMDPKDFLLRNRADDSDVVQVVTLGNSLTVSVRNDRHPHFYTSFDDSTLVCDSFDSSEEDYLTASRVTAYGVELPDFQVADMFTPELPVNMVPLLQHSLNATCSLLFKQQQSRSDETRVARQMAQARRRHSRTQDRTHYYSNAFGRR